MCIEKRAATDVCALKRAATGVHALNATPQLSVLGAEPMRAHCEKPAAPQKARTASASTRACMRAFMARDVLRQFTAAAIDSGAGRCYT